ncbi:MAG: hypothetical protein KAJ18_06470 [Candidatus Omnitrophica bacterium]|nr:hypothetical protein [Candidatus Omnitrophota bacterium]
MYFLEQLVAEWYAYKGFFVRTNMKYGKRKKGGYEGEIDVAAYDPRDKKIIHLEISTDANSWSERKQRFQKKFLTAEKYYKSLFDFEFKEVSKVAVVSLSRPKGKIDFGNNIELFLIPDLIAEIRSEMQKFDVTQSAIPEGYPLLRAIQYSVWFAK